MYTQNFLKRLACSLRKDLRYPLNALIDAQNEYYNMCLDETLRGEVNLTVNLMEEVSMVRRAMLLVKETQKSFAVVENMGMIIDCSIPPREHIYPTKALTGRRMSRFNVFHELISLCRCFERELSFPVRVLVKMCPSVPAVVVADKELFTTFIVNELFQRAESFAGSSSIDMVHDVVILVSKRYPTTRTLRRDCDGYLDVTVVDTGPRLPVTDSGLLASDSSAEDFEGTIVNGRFISTPKSLPFEPSPKVYIQLQEYVFQVAIRIAGGNFRRLDLNSYLSCYGNEVLLSLPVQFTGSVSQGNEDGLSASMLLVAQKVYVRDISSSYKLIFDKLQW